MEKALAMLEAAERPLIVAGGGIIDADARKLVVVRRDCRRSGIPTLMGWVIPDDLPLMAGIVGLQTSHRCRQPDLAEVRSCFGIGNRSANPIPGR